MKYLEKVYMGKYISQAEKEAKQAKSGKEGMLLLTIERNNLP